jgi:AsmA family protein
LAAGEGIDLKVVGHSDDIAQFLTMLGNRAPATARLTGEATLTGTFEALNVADLNVSLDPVSGSTGQPALRATGTIATVRPGGTPLLAGIALRVQGATSTAILSGWLGRPLPDLGPVEGEFTLSGTSEVARLTAITLRAGPDDGLTITAKGSMTAIRPTRAVALRDVDVRLDANAPEPSVIGTLLNISLPPLGALAYAGRLSGGADKWALTGKVHVGGTVIDEDLVASFDGPRPRFAGRLFTAVLHLADFAGASNAAPSASGPPPTGTDSVDLALAHASLDAIDAFDLDLIIDIDRIEGTELAIGGGEVDLTLKDRVLRIDPARFDLSAGTVLAHATADARAQPPRLDLSLHADDVQLGQFVTAMGRSTPITGELALILKLEGRGSSTEALLSSLGGDASFAIQRGDVDLSVNLATADLVTWLLAGARQGTNLVRRGRADARTKLKCLVGRFELERGIATAQSLVMVTPLTSSTATGSLDLVNQTIDLAVHLRARRGGLFDPPSVYRIQGPMADPTVDFSRTGFLARTIAGVVMKPIDALGALLPLVADGGRDPTNPCLQ